MATAPGNCGEAIDLGIKTSRFVTLDPDGQSVKEEPILGFCEVPAGTTILDTDVTVEVGKCHSLHCFQYNMTYAAPLQQMVALIEASGSCSQSIKVECQTAPLQVSSIKINTRSLAYANFTNVIFTTARKFFTKANIATEPYRGGCTLRFPTLFLPIFMAAH